MTLKPGMQLLHYTLAEKLGEGGMGVVWKATDSRLGREVALKVLPAGMATDATRLERFQREARAVAALNHPHIVTLFSIEHDGRTHFLTMELVEGRSLDRLLPPGGLPLAQVFDIGMALADALAAAHEKNVVHRDLKPANIMMGASGRVKILDFGLAKLAAQETAAQAPGDHTAAATQAATPGGAPLTHSGTVMGTAPYMSPEQLEGKPVDHRTDIFALGVVLYEMCTGRRPFAGETSAALISAIMRDAPRPVSDLRQDVPRHLARIIDHCLEKDPELRFQTAKDVRNELRALRKEIDSGTLSSPGTASGPAQVTAPGSMPSTPAGGAAVFTPQPGSGPAVTSTPSTGPGSGATVSTTPPGSGATSTILTDPGSRKGLVWGAAGGAALVLIVIGAFVLGRGAGTGSTTAAGDAGAATAPASTGSEQAGSGPAAAKETTSLAVMPFRNLSADKDQEYFTDGLSEELINALGRIPDLRVAGRASSFSFKGKNEDFATVGKKLGVENILDGSVRKEGDKIRVSVQLVSAADGFQIWSDTYDRTLKDVFAVQDDIARSVASALKVTLLGGATKDKPEPADAGAYDLVLKARFVMQNATKENVGRGRQLLEQALNEAPDYAPAWAEMGLMQFKEGELESSADKQKQTYDEARRSLQKALELDPDLAEAHSRMSNVYAFRDWDFEAALKSTKRALELDPKNTVVLGNAALLYATIGPLDEAIRMEEEMNRTDPLNLTNYRNLGAAYWQSGMRAKALKTWEEGLRLDPDSMYLHYQAGGVLSEEGRVDEARPHFDRFLELIGNDEQDKLLVRIYLTRYGGKKQEADAAMHEYEEKYCATEPSTCALFYAWRGMTDKTFAWLEKSYAIREPALLNEYLDPQMEPLRNDPRWKPFWRKVGIPGV